MVGWSRRNAEDAARQRRYTEWFNSLASEKQEEIRRKNAEEWKKNKPVFVLAMIASLLLVFVGLPMLGLWRAQERWKSEWNAGKVVSQDAKQVCKEVEYCAPCMPIHHWHTEVVCEPVKR